MQIGKYRISYNFRSLRSIFKPLVSHNIYFDKWHIVIGKLSIIIENVKDPLYSVCKWCGSDEIYEKGYLDEGWTVCDGCGAVEGGRDEISLEELENQ